MGGFEKEESIISLCLALSVILPRPDPHDTSWWGGVDFSQPFRRGVGCLTITLFVRAYVLALFSCDNYNQQDHWGKCDENDSWFVRYRVYYLWACLENILRNFLRMLVPYLLQRQLATVIIQVIPGANLTKCLYFIVAMNVVALLFTSGGKQDDRMFWGILVFQDVIVGLILIRTFRHYNRYYYPMRPEEDEEERRDPDPQHDHQHEHQLQQHDRRRQEYAPSMLLRTIVVLEWMQILLSCAAEGMGAIGPVAIVAFSNWNGDSNNTLTTTSTNGPWDKFIVPRIVIQQTLIMMHANLMNAIDQAEYLRRSSQQQHLPPNGLVVNGGMGINQHL
ncbi:hypothetical protein ACA910_015810 [Epithemia clementina (nom. ined.)]